MTQQELAARAGMHKLGVAKLEQGLREPTWATVQALAKALGLTCLDFVAEEGEAPRKTPAPIGRPRSRPAEGNGTAELKRPRGRPRKAPAVAQEARPGDGPADKAVGGEGRREGQGEAGEGHGGLTRAQGPEGDAMADETTGRGDGWARDVLLAFGRGCVKILISLLVGTGAARADDVRGAPPAGGVVSPAARARKGKGAGRGVAGGLQAPRARPEGTCVTS